MTLAFASCSLVLVQVGDAQESIHFVKYKRAENALVTFADDIVTRHTTYDQPASLRLFADAW
jgi:hypothetical protein